MQTVGLNLTKSNLGGVHMDAIVMVAGVGGVIAGMFVGVVADRALAAVSSFWR